MARIKKPAPAVKRRHLQPQEKQQWALLLQALLMDGFAEHCSWTGKEIVFHGGTSLKLGWGSPRWSEDLDFLIRHDLLADSADLMKSSVAHANRTLSRIDAEMRIELKEKKSGQMTRYEVVINKPGIMGNALVKTEFWGVKENYLQQYESVNKIPQPPRELDELGYFVRIRSMFPIATLNSMLCDKIIAAANRPYLKSRDIFDLWWIQQERDFTHPEPDALAKRVMFHTTAYDVGEEDDIEEWFIPQVNFDSSCELALSMAQRLKDWAERVKNPEHAEVAKAELRRFLVVTTGGIKIWERYWSDRVDEMIKTASETVSICANALENMYCSDKEMIEEDNANAPDEEELLSVNYPRPRG